ncbi:MAG: arginase [Chloracidobacterium sp.]|uniref:Arginase n=1 Tax=Chloracidobacterium validum TaxID=2821543 RepID=A0ABX8B8V0_9BACT|nr:arginase [Chloracidobacterium validum]QUW03318.1 arginase [Chloracidobacterium validum]
MANNHPSRQRKATIVGVPMDLGADRRGVDMGPSVVRIAGLSAKLTELGYTVEDIGNVPVALAEMRRVTDTDARHKYLSEVAKSNEILANHVEAILEQGALPVVLGGDHSIAIGSVAGIAAYYRRRGHRIGIIWIDAHADINTPESSPSGNIHGMPLAVLLGYGPALLTQIGGFAPKVRPEDCAIIGVRQIDDGERQLARQLGLRVYTMRDLDERGMSAVMDEALDLVTRHTIGFHATFDMDFVDPYYAPGVGTPVPGGGTYRESHLAMEKIHDSGNMLSVEMVEINAVLDTHNRTGELGAELLLSALGKKIL